MNTQPKRQLNRSVLIIILAIFVFLGLCWALFFFADTDIAPLSEESPSVNPVPMPPPDLQRLATAALQGINQPTPEQLEEEKQLEENQVSFAGEMMANPDAATRAAGAEQLAAYPTETAEKQLANALATDIDASVRTMAAQSLGAFNKPKETSVDALLSGMLDADRSVRRHSLNTLQIYLGREQNGSEQAKKIFGKLELLVKSAQLQPDTLQAVRELLADHASSIRKVTP